MPDVVSITVYRVFVYLRTITAYAFDGSCCKVINIAVAG